MKKLIVLLVLTLGIASVNAQDLTSKKGEKYLPEAGDWAIGIDPTSMLQYLGNFFGKTNNSFIPQWAFPNGNMIIQGKYMKDAKTAYRVGARIGLNTSTTNKVVGNRADSTHPVFPAIPSTVTNKWTHSSTFIGLTAGMEKRMGSTRLQGYYGAEAGIAVSSSKDKYTYGNALNPNGTPAVGVDAVADSLSSNNITHDTYGNTARVTEMKNGSIFYFGVRGFIGAEYFILPKLALGGEFGWAIGINTDGKTSTTTESIGGVKPEVGDQTITSGKGSSISLDTNNNNTVFGPMAALRLTLYFH